MSGAGKPTGAAGTWLLYPLPSPQEVSGCYSSGEEAQVSSGRVMMAAPLPSFLHRHTNTTHTHTFHFRQCIITFFVFRVLQRPQS